MLGEFPRLCSVAIGIAIIAWHSGMLARRFGWSMGMKSFYLRYCALTKSPSKPVAIRADRRR